MIKFGNDVIKFNGNWIVYSGEPAPSLPPYTLRLKFTEGVTPTFPYGGTATQVSSSPNIWDLTYENTDWSNLLSMQNELLEVIAGNTTGVTNMNTMFYYCESLTTVSLFDTSKVTNMGYMLCNCQSLTSIPLFDTSKVTFMSYMFYDCVNVQSGALSLYQQASSLDIPPNGHYMTFYNCGSNTQTGAAELLQIPSDWKY